MPMPIIDIIARDLRVAKAIRESDEWYWSRPRGVIVFVRECGVFCEHTAERTHPFPSPEPARE